MKLKIGAMEFEGAPEELIKATQAVADAGQNLVETAVVGRSPSTQETRS